MQGIKTKDNSRDGKAQKDKGRGLVKMKLEDFKRSLEERINQGKIDHFILTGTHHTDVKCYIPLIDDYVVYCLSQDKVVAEVCR